MALKIEFEKVDAIPDAITGAGRLGFARQAMNKFLASGFALVKLSLPDDFTVEKFHHAIRKASKHPSYRGMIRVATRREDLYLQRIVNDSERTVR